MKTAGQCGANATWREWFLSYLTIVLGALATLGLFVQTASAAPGELDTSFGSGGVVTTSIDTNGQSEAPPIMTLLADDKLLVVGSTTISDGGCPGFCSGKFALARYNADGSLDNSFGGGDGMGFTEFPSVQGGRAHALALQADGKIVVAGESGEADLLIVRFNADGTLDTGFGGGDGFVSTNFGAYLTAADAVVLQPDGKIITAGQYLIEEAGTYSNHAIIARYSSDGTLDTAFGGGDGFQITEFGAPAALGEALALQPDGKIVLAGDAFAGGYGHTGLARYNSDGSPDTAFGGGDGLVMSENYIGPSAMVLEADGKLLLGGSGNSQFALTRYNSDGTLDTAFGGGDGSVITHIGDPYSWLRGLALQPDGGIVAAGGVGEFDSPSDFALARYTASGILDTGFGGGGMVTTDFGSEGFATGVAVQADGKIIAGGQGDGEFALARYEGGASPAPTAYTLSVNKSGTGAGGVSSAPSGINCGSTCSHGFDEGTSVTLTVAPAAGSTFAGWSGGGCSGTGACQTTLNADTTVTATFTSSEGGGPGGETPPPPSPGPTPSATPPPTSNAPTSPARQRKCPKGFKKRKVHGKKKCVRAKRKHPRQRRAAKGGHRER